MQNFCGYSEARGIVGSFVFNIRLPASMSRKRNFLKSKKAKSRDKIALDNALRKFLKLFTGHYCF